MYEHQLYIYEPIHQQICRFVYVNDVSIATQNSQFLLLLRLSHHRSRVARIVMNISLQFVLSNTSSTPHPAQPFHISFTRVFPPGFLSFFQSISWYWCIYHSCQQHVPVVSSLNMSVSLWPFLCDLLCHWCYFYMFVSDFIFLRDFTHTPQRPHLIHIQSPFLAIRSWPCLPLFQCCTMYYYHIHTSVLHHRDAQVPEVVHLNNKINSPLIFLVFVNLPFPPVRTYIPSTVFWSMLTLIPLHQPHTEPHRLRGSLTLRGRAYLFSHFLCQYVSYHYRP